MNWPFHSLPLTLEVIRSLSDPSHKITLRKHFAFYLCPNLGRSEISLAVLVAIKLDLWCKGDSIFFPIDSHERSFTLTLVRFRLLNKEYMTFATRGMDTVCLVVPLKFLLECSTITSTMYVKILFLRLKILSLSRFNRLVHVTETKSC